MHILDIAVVAITGLMVGIELTVSLFIHPVVRQLDGPSQARTLSIFATVLGRVMPFWYALCLVLLIAETVLRRNTTAFPILLSAAVLWAATILCTLFFLVPLNNRIAMLQPASPREGWMSIHERWNRRHNLRIAAILASLVLTLHALLPA